MTKTNLPTTDPIGMKLPEWEAVQLWCGKGGSVQIAPRTGFQLVFTTECEHVVWELQNVKYPGVSTPITLQRALESARNRGLKGVRILTYQDGRFLCLAEFLV